MIVFIIGMVANVTSVPIQAYFAGFLILIFILLILGSQRLLIFAYGSTVVLLLF